MTVDALLQSIPPLTVYVVVGLVVGIESLGIPLPGEIVLVSAALLSSRHELAVNPIGVGVAAVIGAVVGDSTGYGIGRRLGLPLFDRLGRRFPNHFGPGHVAFAERLFRSLGRTGGVLGPFHRVAADIRRATGRGAKDALRKVFGRQRVGRGVLGGRHHRLGLLRGCGRRTLADPLLLDCLGCRCGVRADRRSLAAGAGVPRGSRTRGRALQANPTTPLPEYSRHRQTTRMFFFLARAGLSTYSSPFFDTHQTAVENLSRPHLKALPIRSLDVSTGRRVRCIAARGDTAIFNETY